MPENSRPVKRLSSLAHAASGAPGPAGCPARPPARRPSTPPLRGRGPAAPPPRAQTRRGNAALGEERRPGRSQAAERRLVGVACGVDQERHPAQSLVGAEALRQRHAITVGQRQLQDHRVEASRTRHRLGVRGGPGVVARHPGARQQLPQHPGQVRVGLHQEHGRPHGEHRNATRRRLRRRGRTHLLAHGERKGDPERRPLAGRAFRPDPPPVLRHQAQEVAVALGERHLAGEAPEEARGCRRGCRPPSRASPRTPAPPSGCSSGAPPAPRRWRGRWRGCRRGRAPGRRGHPPAPHSPARR